MLAFGIGFALLIMIVIIVFTGSEIEEEQTEGKEKSFENFPSSSSFPHLYVQN